MRLAFSYQRFSSEKQEQGDSLRRQLKLAEDYAHKHGLTVDTSTYRDLGISAFKGKNKDEGALAAFLEAVDKKKIPSGSYLLVESLDRLSRESVDSALELFLSIIKRGITIVTLQDQQVYSTVSVKDNWTKLIIALAVMSRAHEESLTKSNRVKEAWAEKRKSGEIMTTICPAWLTYHKGAWKVDAKKVAVVTRIFKLALDGNGSPTIARLLNEEGLMTIGPDPRPWSFGTVHAILKNSSVIGTFTPKKAKGDPIEGYYPEIISRELFYEVQARVSSRQWTGGRNTDNVRNLFSSLCFCSVCGSKMRAVGSNAQHTYLRCLSAYSGSGCEAGRMPYLAAEKAILFRFNAQNRELIPEVKEIEESQAAVYEAQIEEGKKKIENLISLAEATGDIAMVAQRINQSKADIAKAQQSLEALQTPLLNIRDAVYTRAWYEDLGSSEGSAAIELRKKIQASIRRFIKRIEMSPERMELKLFFVSGKQRVLSITEYKEQVGGSRRK